MKKQNTTAKVGHKEPDRYPLGKFSKRLANRTARKMAKVAASQITTPADVSAAISRNLTDLV